MKIKTSELSDLALDWAVAFCVNRALGTEQYSVLEPLEEGQVRYSPSTNWEDCGPIISEHPIQVGRCSHYYGGCGPAHKFVAFSQNRVTARAFGATPLIAAMRCYVTSELGDEVDVPEELLS